MSFPVIQLCALLLDCLTSGADNIGIILGQLLRVGMTVKHSEHLPREFISVHLIVLKTVIKASLMER